MLFSEKWLRSYINPDLNTKDLAETLTMAGLEVEAVTPRAPEFSGVVVAKVLECVPHENSDHLHVCKVDAGTGEELQIVCGAPNVRAGIKVACAMIGAVLPGDFKIKRSKLRGVVSCGMLCSCRELGISEEHDGIWILADDAPIGEDIRKYADLDDSVIEIKLTPNRGDALSLIGVARDLRAVTGGLFCWKFAVMVLILAACVFIFRAFCRFICPLGAVYSLFAKIALLGVRVDLTKCTDCGACVKTCPMDIRNVGDRECIQCGNCIDICPEKAISFKAGKLVLRGPDIGLEKREEQK